jgi:hypothetical protein
MTITYALPYICSPVLDPNCRRQLVQQLARLQFPTHLSKDPREPDSVPNLVVPRAGERGRLQRQGDWRYVADA